MRTRKSGSTQTFRATTMKRGDEHFLNAGGVSSSFLLPPLVEHDQHTGVRVGEASRPGPGFFDDLDEALEGFEEDPPLPADVSDDEDDPFDSPPMTAMTRFVPTLLCWSTEAAAATILPYGRSGLRTTSRSPTTRRSYQRSPRRERPWLASQCLGTTLALATWARVTTAIKLSTARPVRELRLPTQPPSPTANP